MFMVYSLWFEVKALFLKLKKPLQKMIWLIFAPRKKTSIFEAITINKKTTNNKLSSWLYKQEL
jgi:hypothetical protein